MGFSGGSVVKNLPANAENTGSIPECREDPLEQGMAIHSSIFGLKTQGPRCGLERPRKSHEHAHGLWPLLRPENSVEIP